MRTADLHLPAGSATDGPDPLLITPERAGWRYTGLRVLRLAPGEPRQIVTGEDEMGVLPLTATGVTVVADGLRFDLAGRESVFARVSDFAYLPRDAEARITSTSGGDVALPSARARRRLPPAYGPAEAVPVEVRGAGAATRQLNNFLAPGVFDADRLVAVEVLTPDGNVSSYPPHKHDEQHDARPGEPHGESDNEEIYYFRLDAPHGFGLHRTYTAGGEIDATVTVRDGDAFLIPRGYHGPSVALPGFPLYYLNVLAGPGDERSLAFRDDPAHAWIRESWKSQTPDPRVPLTSATGRLA